MYKTPAEGYQMLEDMMIHNIEWTPDKRMAQRRFTGNISTDCDSNEEVTALCTSQKALKKKIESLTQSIHAIQVGC